MTKPFDLQRQGEPWVFPGHVSATSQQCRLMLAPMMQTQQNLIS